MTLFCLGLIGTNRWALYGIIMAMYNSTVLALTDTAVWLTVMLVICRDCMKLRQHYHIFVIGSMLRMGTVYENIALFW